MWYIVKVYFVLYHMFIYFSDISNHLFSKHICVCVCVFPRELQGATSAIQEALFEPKLRMHITTGIQWNVKKTVPPGCCMSHPGMLPLAIEGVPHQQRCFSIVFFRSIPLTVKFIGSYMCVRVYACACWCVCCECVYMYVCVVACVYMCVCVYVCGSMCMYVCVCVFM